MGKWVIAIGLGRYNKIGVGLLVIMLWFNDFVAEVLAV